MRKAPAAVRKGFWMGSPSNELVTKENNRAVALHIGTAMLISEFAKRT
eukprot:CAMPEP_0168281628 /NCGR_PEP_ID=MMETSP0141_2-20121125/21854_1 /TAXON_ID=44445 /ORGANISM="Pseudo-nitzschia australis, Strain 10249 10 AB" /LENGTH=47 /DNA_ID= /DNA_START= /DNA_END= /DNA_ORIENTATION=